MNVNDFPLQSYLIRWINVKAENTISWSIQPHKKSINFAIFKHPGHIGDLTPYLGPVNGPVPNTPNSDNADSQKDSPSNVVDRLTTIGLKQVAWLGRCEADKISQGKYDVSAGHEGNYAMVFDNTFSKQISKTATLMLMAYPTAYPPQLGAQVHHSLASSTISSNGTGSLASPRVRSKKRKSLESLQNNAQAPGQPPVSLVSPTSPHHVSDASTTTLASVHTGILHKRRRKRHQGFARRFFSLDFSSGTLSYYHDRNSSALRGAVPLSLAAIGANADTREISVDSGAEVWHLRALTHADFQSWKEALEKASRSIQGAASPGTPLKLQTSPSQSMGTGKAIDDQDWSRVEALVGRIAGTRDAVRRLARNTDPRQYTPPTSSPDREIETPPEGEGLDYFPTEAKRPFWKRKPSGQNAPQSGLFRRSASGQLTPSLEPTIRNLRVRSRSPAKVENDFHAGMHDHCNALLRDLDSVVAEFTALIAESRQRRLADPKSSVSRLSTDSFESQEFFDATEDRAASPFLRIRNDSNERVGTDDDAFDDALSASESDTGEEDSYFDSGKGLGLDTTGGAFPSKPRYPRPSPTSPIHRRTNIQAPSITPPSLIGFLRKNVGKDLSTISMPVSANEPTSLLQRAAEQFEYSELLDQAATAKESIESLIYVAAFAISTLSNVRVKERSIRKPFNPMLGETFEFVREDKDFTFLAEKVSHRPVQLAFQADSQDWSFTQSPLPSQKFWGKSSEIITEGKARLSLHSAGTRYSWTSATSFLRNIIAGEKYVEPVGSMVIVSENDGQKAIVNFKAKGMFAGRSEDVSVQVVDANGHALSLGLLGSWTQQLRLTQNGQMTERLIWTAGPLVDNAAKHYGFPLFAASVNEITKIEEGHLPPTDSRLRPDQRALEDGEYDTAERLKNALEENQRHRRKEMEEQGEQWRPRWFSRLDLPDGEVVWKLKTGKDSYWEERAKGSWDGVTNVLAV